MNGMGQCQGKLKAVPKCLQHPSGPVPKLIHGGATCLSCKSSHESGGDMTVTFLNTSPPAVFCSPSTQTQKQVSMKHSPRFPCATCAQHRLPLSAIKL